MIIELVVESTRATVPYGVDINNQSPADVASDAAVLCGYELLPDTTFHLQEPDSGQTIRSWEQLRHNHVELGFTCDSV